jgi:glutathione S-transferase
MVLKFYAVPYPSRGSGLVYLLLAEKQIPFELVAVDLKAKEQKKPEFLAMHPFGQVPVIVGGPLSLWSVCSSRYASIAGR